MMRARPSAPVYHSVSQSPASIVTHGFSVTFRSRFRFVPGLRLLVDWRVDDVASSAKVTATPRGRPLTSAVPRRATGTVANRPAPQPREASR
jgi:hypothetical protein